MSACCVCACACVCVRACVNVCMHIMYNLYFSCRLELIPLSRGSANTDPSSPIASIASVLFLQLERLDLEVLLYVFHHFFCRCNSFEAVFVLSSHHMTVNVASRIPSVIHATASVRFFQGSNKISEGAKPKLDRACYMYFVCMFNPMLPDVCI